METTLKPNEKTYLDIPYNWQSLGMKIEDTPNGIHIVNRGEVIIATKGNDLVVTYNSSNVLRFEIR